MENQEMESFYITQNGNLKGTSYLPLILKTDMSLGRNSHPSYIFFFSFSVQILLIIVNWNFTQTHRFQKALPRRQLYHKKSAPALPSPGISSDRDSEELHCANEGNKNGSSEMTFTSVSCTSPLNSIWSSFHKRGDHPHPWVLEPPRGHGGLLNHRSLRPKEVEQLFHK